MGYGGWKASLTNGECYDAFRSPLDPVFGWHGVSGEPGDCGEARSRVGVYVLVYVKGAGDGGCANCLVQVSYAGVWMYL